MILYSVSRDHQQRAILQIVWGGSLVLWFSPISYNFALQSPTIFSLFRPGANQIPDTTSASPGNTLNIKLNTCLYFLLQYLDFRKNFLFNKKILKNKQSLFFF